MFTPEELHRTFYTTRFGRRLDKYRYVRFRSWRVYEEHGLPGQPAVVWLYGETLTIAFNDVALAQYRVNYQHDLKHLRTIDEPRMFNNPYRSPQLPLWELGDDDWLKVVRLPDYPRRTPQRVMGTQAALPF